MGADEWSPVYGVRIHLADAEENAWLTTHGFDESPIGPWTKEFDHTISAFLYKMYNDKRWQCFIDYEGTVTESFDHRKKTYAYGDTPKEAYEKARELMLRPIDIERYIEGLDAKRKE